MNAGRALWISFLCLLLVIALLVIGAAIYDYGYNAAVSGNSETSGIFYSYSGGQAGQGNEQSAYYDDGYSSNVNGKATGDSAGASVAQPSKSSTSVQTQTPGASYGAGYAGSALASGERVVSASSDFRSYPAYSRGYRYRYYHPYYYSYSYPHYGFYYPRYYSYPYRPYPYYYPRYFWW